MRKKRRALVESLDEELHTRDLLDPVSAAYENVLSFQELSGKLTHKQRQIAALRAQGYHDLEIARMFQVKPGEIKLEMDQARSKGVPFPTETAALAAYIQEVSYVEHELLPIPKHLWRCGRVSGRTGAAKRTQRRRVQRRPEYVPGISALLCRYGEHRGFR